MLRNLAALAVAVTWLSWSNLAAPAAEQRPNIVFIIADDLGWADVAFHGGNAPTPNLDRLAREGLELTAHYVAPVCSPTRTGLMTGRCWSRFGVTSPQNERALQWDTVTLPRALKSVGYETCLSGKWHLGSKPEWGPNHFGFDHSFGSLAGGVGPWNHFYKEGPFTKTWHRNEQLIETPGHVTDLIADEAAGWIANRGDKPFFLYVPFTAIHLPLREPDEFVKRVPELISGDVPRHYAASVMHFDAAVGKLVSALEKAGKRENTLLVITSDNGGSTAQNNDTKYPADNYPNGKLTGNNVPWRGEKGQVYEGGIRVACVANWPGRIKPGKLDTPRQITDWMPTFCQLAGYKPEKDLKWDGRDSWPLLSGETSTAEVRPIYTVGPGFNSRSLRLGDWKLVKHTGAKVAKKPELYDLAHDPGEQKDLSGEQPKKLAEMLAELDKVAARDRDSVVEKERSGE